MLILFLAGCGGDEHSHSLVDRLRDNGMPTPQPGVTFQVAARISQLEQYPCVRCHSQPNPRSPDGKKAHGRIVLRHAREVTMNCESCHAPGNREGLRLLGGAAVSFDESYLVCAQCHHTQFEDLKGGAHGKRANGWAEERVAFNCAECHNPHTPSFEARWPARAPTGGANR